MQRSKSLKSVIDTMRTGLGRLNGSMRAERLAPPRSDSGNSVPLFRIIFLSTAIVVLGVVAILQYRWNSQIRAASEANVGTNLESRMIKWHLDFYGEFSTICVALQIGPDSGERDSWEDYLHRYARWNRAARSTSRIENLYVNPDLVKDIYVWETSRVLGPRLLRLNAEQERIEDFAISPEMRPLLSYLQKYSSTLQVALRAWAGDTNPNELRRKFGNASPSYLLRSNAETGWQFDETIPALVHPIFHYVHHGQAASNKLSPNSPVDWVVVALNLETIRQRILPELMQQYFSNNQGLEYKIAVVAEGKPSRVLYTSDAGFGEQDLASFDSVMNVFGPPPESTEGHLWQAEKRAALVKGEDWRRFSSPVWFPIIQRTPDTGFWALVLQSRKDPPDAAVVKVWHSNLYIGELLLLLLLATVVQLVVVAERAKKLARLRMNFVASVSHELHTPLTVISSAAENIVDGFARSETRLVEHGSIIKGQAHRLKRLVDQILLFSSIENGKLRYMQRHVEGRELVECVRAHAAAATAGASFTIEEHIDANLPSVMGDFEALSQCLENLITNAVKYSGRSRWIGILVETRILENLDRELRISVQDRGIGIDRTELARVFKAFFRSSRVVAAQIRGTGLGLAIAKHIAEGMGGYISVTSELEVGSTFTLHLPVLAVSGASPLLANEETEELGNEGQHTFSRR
jgi:signal transduction histidine kinase